MNMSDTSINDLLAAHPGAGFRVKTVSGLTVTGPVTRETGSDATFLTVDEYVNGPVTADGQQAGHTRRWLVSVGHIVSLAPLD